MFNEKLESIIDFGTTSFFERTKGLCFIRLQSPSEIEYGTEPTMTALSNGTVIRGALADVYEDMIKHGIDYELCPSTFSKAMDIDRVVYPIFAVTYDNLERLYQALPSNVSDRLCYIRNVNTIHYTDPRLEHIHMCRDTMSVQFNKAETSVWTGRLNDSSYDNRDSFKNDIVSTWKRTKNVACGFNILASAIVGTDLVELYNLDELIERIDEIYYVNIKIVLDDETHTISEMNELIAKLRLLGLFRGVANPDRYVLEPFILDLEL